MSRSESANSSTGPRTESGSTVRLVQLSNEEQAGGYREVLRIAVPLILSTASLTVSLFANRMFLSWHGRSSVAAASPGGIVYFTIVSLFLGTAQYVNSIVAQHHGLGDRPACARAVWQGIWVSVLCAPLILLAIPVGTFVLAGSGHEPELIKLEIDYFTLLMLGGVAVPLNAAISSFFSGRGHTWMVMWGNIAGNAANCVLDYVLIFGKLGFPEMGIRGAGLATAVTGFIPTVIWFCAFLARRYQQTYKTRAEWRWDSRILMMLMRYGIPSGVQFFLDVASFTVFVILIGRLGEIDLAAANIVTSIEMLSYLPMVGMSIATATLVGEYIGQGRIHLAEKSVRSALRLALGYSAILAFLFFVVPESFLELFRHGAEQGLEFQVIIDKGSILLRLVALWTLFDAVFIVYSGALKGAGDTKFSMWAQILAAWVVFVPPVYAIIEYFNMGLYAAWGWCLAYMAGLGTAFWLRFRYGHWKEIRMLHQP